MIDSPLAVIRAAVASLGGLHVVDIGCGKGGLAGLLAAEGAIVVGIDPDSSAVRSAQAAVPGASFELGTAENVPFGGGSFDLVVMMNALHHIPVESMDSALREAVRVVKPDGRIVVIEPLADGSFFEALRVVEDETAVRQAAQHALKRAVADRVLNRVGDLNYVRQEIFDNADHFLERIIAVDRSREALVKGSIDVIRAGVQSAAERTSEGKLALDQPIKAVILAPGAHFS